MSSPEFVAVAAAVAALLLGWWLGGARARGASDTALRETRSELSRRLNDVFALQELSFMLSESLQPARIAEQVTSYLARFTDVQGSLVALAADGGRTLRVAAATGTLSALRNREIAEDDEGLVAGALHRDQYVLEDGTGTRPVLAAGITAARAAVFPLRAHGVTVGVLAVTDPGRTRFDPEDLRLLSTVATHAAIVLSNARFFDLVRAGRDQWETTFNALSEGLAVVDETGRIRRANRALAGLVGHSVPSLVGMSLSEAALGGSHELVELLDAARRREGAPVRTVQLPRLGRVFRVSAAAMRGEDDTAWAVVLIEDVTEQQRLEAQLVQSEKMAAVGQLVSGVAHELNNPLTSIAGLTEFLLEQPAPTDRDRDHLRVIREQADRAGRIVRNLLTFARKGPADVGEVDINDIVQRTVSLVGYEIRLREVHLELALDPALPPLTGDRYQIQQVVLNLVTNAIQAVQDNPPDRPRRIGIVSELDGPQVRLRVRDSGPGIPEDLVPQIFTPFFTTKAPGHGTGLGLSISYRIIEGHGGTLRVQRAVDGGAVFVMQLPVRSPVPVPVAPLGSAVAGPEEHDLPSAPQRAILLVDEDPAIRRMIGVLLSGPSQVVETASEAGQALELLDAHAFDLVIADARVPVSAGERLGDTLLRRWPNLRTRTIFLTADVRPETDAWLQELGCPYFLKPFRIGELKAETARILRAQGLATQ
ncbi:MAG: ATP-binding protein [Gemmatimonadota bacterium]|nr:ATP-binding protein [Gemmatimonadota bacterium]